VAACGAWGFGFEVFEGGMRGGFCLLGGCFSVLLFFCFFCGVGLFLVWLFLPLAFP
jgi:hypothetical protein